MELPSTTAFMVSQLTDFDEMSDSDGEHGNAREPPGPMPQDHSDLRRIRIAKRRRRDEVYLAFGDGGYILLMAMCLDTDHKYSAWKITPID